MKIKASKLKLYSKLGSRASFGMATLELSKEYENLMVLTADVSTSAGLDRYRKTYPDKFLDTGIAEQNMIGIATGLATEGYDVITATFAPFQTMRCCEQIRVNLGYMDQKVIMVGLASGIVLGSLGFTHCSFEDIGVLRSIPNITIISPADCGETVKATAAALKYNQSVYIRLTGGSNASMVYKEDYEYEIGKAITLSKGNDVTIIASGTMVYQSMEAKKILELRGLSVGVINMHTIKPIDSSAIIEASINSKLIVTVEEHNIIGGLGSAVAEVLITLDTKVKQVMIGINDRYTKAAEYNDLLEEYGLTDKQIAITIQNNIKE